MHENVAPIAMVNNLRNLYASNKFLNKIINLISKNQHTKYSTSYKSI